MIVHIGRVLEESSNTMPAISKALEEARVFNAWKGAATGKIAKNTELEKFTGGTLFLKAKSSAWAQELSMLKEKLVERLNGALGKSIVCDIKFRAGVIRSDKEEKDEKGAGKKVCIKCGAEFTGDNKTCSFCERETKEKDSGEIYRMLSKRPWLAYGGIGEVQRRIGQEEFYKMKRRAKDSLMDKLVVGKIEMKKEAWESLFHNYAEALLSKKYEEASEGDIKGIRKVVQNKANNYSRRRMRG